MNKLYCGDCKSVLERLIKSKKKVDLIYLDPPFNSNRIYNLVFRGGGKGAQQKTFDDMWRDTAQTQQMLLDFGNALETADISESVKSFLKAWIEPLSTGARSDKSLVAYLV